MHHRLQAQVSLGDVCPRRKGHIKHLAAPPARPEAHVKGQRVCAPIPGHLPLPRLHLGPTHTRALNLHLQGEGIKWESGRETKKCLRAETLLQKSLQLKLVTSSGFRQQTSHLLSSLASSLALRPTFPPYLFPPTSTS